MNRGVHVLGGTLAPGDPLGDTCMSIWVGDGRYERGTRIDLTTEEYEDLYEYFRGLPAAVKREPVIS